MQTEDACVRRLVVGIVLVVCMALVLTGVAEAVPVTFQFGGTIQSASSPLSSTIASSTKISGSYTFESTTPDLITIGDPSNNVGSYVLSSFSVNFSGRTYSMFSSTGPREIRVENSSTSDAYRVLLIPTGLDQALTGPAINGLVPRSFQFNITGINLVSSGALPLTPPSIGSINPSQRRFNMVFSGGGVAGALDGMVTSLTLAPVPLPGALLLFGSGLLGVAGLGVRRRLRKPMNE